MLWNTWTILILLAGAAAGYLLGSVNFAIIITRLSGKGDIRDYGSGNAGMTNVLRTVGKGAAALTLLGDFSKGILSVIFVRLLLLLYAWASGTPVSSTVLADYIVAYAALLGHVFPLFYHFKGGKGILVSAGCMLILGPWSLVICLAAFLLLAVTTQYISVGSIAAGVAYPIANGLVTWAQTGQIGWLEVCLALPIAALVIFLHRANIRRLLTHTESKVSFRKKQ